MCGSGRLKDPKRKKGIPTKPESKKEKAQESRKVAGAHQTFPYQLGSWKTRVSSQDFKSYLESWRSHTSHPTCQQFA